MLHARVAQSDDPDSIAATGDVIASLRSDRGVPSVIFVWAAIDTNHEYLLASLADAFPGAAVIGCTTDGEASSADVGFAQDSIVAMALWSDTLELGVGVGRNLSADPRAAAKHAVAEAKAQLGGEPRLALIFPESLTDGSEAVLNALVEELGPGTVVAGATSGDQQRLEATHQYLGREVLSDALPVVLLGGGLKLSHGVASGWHPLGREVNITRAEGNVVHEVDGQPFLDFYRSYFGPESLPCREQPLAVFQNGGDQFYLRAPRGTYGDDGSVMFLGDVPQGARAVLTDVDRDSIVAAAQQAAKTALERFDGAPAAALFFSCAGRRTVLGTRVAEEHRVLKEILPEALPFAGFYGYGEIGPLVPGGRARLHNESFITVLLGE